MPEMWLVYFGTIGSILKAYIEKQYRVNVREQLLAHEYHMPNKNVVFALIVDHDFDRQAYQALRQYVGDINIVWMCQNPGNHEKPDSSVIKYMCADVNEWDLLNIILEKYLAPNL